MAFDTTPRNPDNAQYTDLGILYPTSLSGIDTSKYYTILSSSGSYTFEGSTVTGTYPGYALGIVNTTKDYNIFNKYYQIQSTSPYTQTITIGGVPINNAPGIGTNPTPGLVTVSFATTNVTMSIFNLNSLSNTNSSKYYKIQSTSPYTQTITIGGVPINNAPGIGTNPTPGLVTVSFATTNVTMSIFNPTNIGYYTSRRPLKGMLYPRAKNVPVGIGSTVFLTYQATGIGTGTMSVNTPTRHGYLSGKRPYRGQVYP